jgi:hypothetical protein
VIEPFSCQRGRPTSTNPQRSDSNNNLGLTPRQTGPLIVSRNITLPFKIAHVEVVLNTSTAALQVVGGDEKGTQCLEV